MMTFTRFFHAAAVCAAAFMLNACVSDSVIDGRPYADYTGSRWARSGIGSQKDEKTALGALHRGFRIDPLPGSDWVVNFAHQRPNSAEWAKLDFEEKTHTTVASVSATPVLSKTPSQEELKKFTETWAKKQETDRIRDVKYTVSEGKRGETPTVEVRVECTDTGTNPVSRMFFEGFFCVTKQNQMLFVMVSERSLKPDFQYTGKNAAEFFRMLTW